MKQKCACGCGSAVPTSIGPRLRIYVDRRHQLRAAYRAYYARQSRAWKRRQVARVRAYRVKSRASPGDFGESSPANA